MKIWLYHLTLLAAILAFDIGALRGLVITLADATLHRHRTIFHAVFLRTTAEAGLRALRLLRAVSGPMVNLLAIPARAGRRLIVNLLAILRPVALLTAAAAGTVTLAAELVSLGAEGDVSM